MNGQDGSSGNNSLREGIRVYYCHNSHNSNGQAATLAELGIQGNVAVEPVPCSGKVDPRYMLKALEAGARAICVLTCPTGDCKMMEGNLRAARRVHTVRELLREAGLDPNAVQIFDPSSFEEPMSPATTTASPFPEEEQQQALRRVA